MTQKSFFFFDKHLYMMRVAVSAEANAREQLNTISSNNDKSICIVCVAVVDDIVVVVVVV